MSTTEVTLSEVGTGRPALVLYGGGGPASVATIAEHLGESMRAILPTHPGWNETPRPDSISSIPDRAVRYPDLLAERDLSDVRIVAGDPYMYDPGLQPRLAAVTIPTLVLWGDSDGIASPAYGEVYARSFGNARYEVISDAGHLPQIEQPGATLAAIDAFVAR